MIKNPPALVSDKHPVLSLLLILALVGMGFVLVGPLIGMLVASAFYDTSLLNSFSNPDPKMVAPLMVVQGFTTLIGLIVLPIIYVTMMENKSIKKFFTYERDFKVYFILLVLGVCFMVAISPVIEWNMGIQLPDFLKQFDDWARDTEGKLAEVTKLMTDFTSFGQFAASLFVIALLPAIGEELVFRGLIQNEILRGTRNVHVAIWFAAILFSAIHMQFFGFVPRVLLGAMFGYLYWWSGNLTIPIVAHFIHNGFTLTMIYLYNIGSVDIDGEESAPVTFVIVTLVVTAIILFYLRKYFTSSQTSDESN